MAYCADDRLSVSSMIHREPAHHFIKACQYMSPLSANVSISPTTSKADLARVKATFIRFQSETNPILPDRFDRTVEKMIMSRSRPWYPSTDFTSINADVDRHNAIISASFDNNLLIRWTCPL